MALNSFILHPVLLNFERKWSSTGMLEELEALIRRQKHRLGLHCRLASGSFIGTAAYELACDIL